MNLDLKQLSVDQAIVQLTYTAGPMIPLIAGLLESTPNPTLDPKKFFGCAGGDSSV